MIPCPRVAASDKRAMLNRHSSFFLALLSLLVPIHTQTTHLPAILQGKERGRLCMSLWNAVKRTLDAYLERLASENKKMFGDSRPDCCTLNAKKQAKKPQK